MSLDLAQFHDVFFEESFEALASMEAALLAMNAGAPDPELVNTVFRVAHSIKGGSATFGFTEVASFTHTAETLLDQLRDGKLEVTPHVLDLLLQSVDVMRDMLTAVQTQAPIDTQRSKELQAGLTAALGDGKRAAPAPQAATPAAAPSTPAPAGDGRRGWRIRFVPGASSLMNANDPLAVLFALGELGDLTARVDAIKLPPLAECEPATSYLGWELELVGDVPRERIDDVFDWVAGDAELKFEAFGAAAPEPVPEAAPVATPEPVAAAPAAAEPAQPKTAAGEAARPAAAESSSIRVNIEKIDELLNAVGELVITQSVLSQLATGMEGHDAEEMRSALGQLERHMRALQESVMRVRMLPISSVFNRFPRMVRDLGQRLGKKVELQLSGEHTELDKTVLEKIGDPLVHLVRNSIDHGIESPEKRRAAGKSETGTIKLHAYHKGGNITVEVSDDGAGLNRDRILAKARERGLVGPDEELTDERVFNLIFAPGFSTAEVVSDVSGRGVGMDVVKRNIAELGGQVQIHSNPGAGSTVRIRLPLTLAILDGQLVRVGQETYVVPIVSIVETIQVRREQVSSIANRAELFRLRDEYIPIIRLYDLFGVVPDHTDLLRGLLMIVESDGKRVGIFVDELLAQQQVVIKSLEANFRPMPGLAGATMLGDGRVALILDVPGVITTFQTREAGRTAAPRAA